MESKRITIISIKKVQSPKSYRGIEVWNKKKKKRHFKIEEMQFFDGTDMYRWYKTQIYCFEKLNDAQKEKINHLKPHVSNKKKLLELYKRVLKLERFPHKKEASFSDKSDMNQFIKQIQNKEIILSLEEQQFFYELLKLTIRLRKDGKLGNIQYSNKPNKTLKSTKPPKIQNSYKKKKIPLETKGFLLKPMTIKSIAYFFEKQNLTRKEIAKILNITFKTSHTRNPNLYFK